jgi:glycosyltransferase involved in cell wall biosynthesis
VNAPLRVRHVLKGLGPGGAERLVVTQASVDEKHHHDVVYLLPQKKHLVPILDDAGIESHCLDAPSAARLGWMWRLRRLMIADPTDVLHIHSPAVAAIARILVRTVPRDRRPVLIGTEHNRWPRHHKLTRLANRYTIRLEAATIAVSAAVASTVEGGRPGQVRVIEHGIDNAAVAAQADRAEVRRELGFADDDIVVMNVANLRREKSLDLLVEAAAQVLRETSELRYVQIGQGPLAAELDGWVTAAGLQDRFMVLGYREDVPRLLSGADAFTLSSTHEGLPVAIMEALALGLPIVATDAGGVADAAGRAGLISPVGDLAAFTANQLAIGRDAGLRTRLDAAAPAESARFEIRRALEEVSEVYAEAMTGARRRSSNQS